jgi:uncharacterized protein with PIN domain
MALIYANENLPLRVVAALRVLGHDVLTTSEAGNAGKAIPDDEVLAFAVQHQRVVVTLNRKHFIRLHNQHSEHYGIMVCSFDLDYDALARRIHEAIIAEPHIRSRLLRINRPG